MASQPNDGLRTYSGAVALITGGASGIGAALGRELVKRGAKVVLADRQLELAQKLAKDLGENARAVSLDVREPAAFAAVAAGVVETEGRIDYFFNNAGIGLAGLFEDHSLEDWKYIVDINLLGVVSGLHCVYPIMLKQGYGHIINTASEAGLVTSSVLGMYAAPTHAVVGLTESLYRELEGTGVGVHCLCPNLVDTQIFHSERNRDDGEAMKPSQVATLAPLREAIAALGIGTEQVAGDVIDAIHHYRFWIFTHEITRRAAAARFADIEAGRNPTQPYEGIEELETLSDLG